MKKITTVLLVAILVCLFGFQPAASLSKKKKVSSFKLRKAPNQILIKYRTTSPKVKNRARKRAGIKRIIRSIPANTELTEIQEGVSLNQALSKLGQDTSVETAEPNLVVKSMYGPRDPLFPKQWGLFNFGQRIRGVRGKVRADIKATKAWNIDKGTRRKIKVAVIDTGADFSHPEFAGRLIDGYNFSGLSQLSVTNTPWMVGSNSSNQYYAQSIKGTGQKLTEIGILLQKIGNPNQNISVSLRQSLTGPNLSSISISPTEIKGIEIIRKSLPAPVLLNSGERYFLVINSTNDNPNNYFLLYDNDNGREDYIDGNCLYSNNGSQWINHQSDLFFITNGNPNALDDNGHGTHVAGILGANAGNRRGGVGVSFGAKIIPVKVLDASGSGFLDQVLSGIYYAANHGARVINMSLGGAENSALLQQAINYARAKGTVVVAAAGNSGGYDYFYPGANAGVIGVAATNSFDTKASFSTYNRAVDVAAPGVDILSTMPTYFVTLNGEGYGIPRNYAYLSGTSMSTPVVAGEAAVIFSYKRNRIRRRDVERLIMISADDKRPKGRDIYYGFGRINLFKALRRLKARRRR